MLRLLMLMALKRIPSISTNYEGYNCKKNYCNIAGIPAASKSAGYLAAATIVDTRRDIST